MLHMFQLKRFIQLNCFKLSLNCIMVYLGRFKGVKLHPVSHWHSNKCSLAWKPQESGCYRMLLVHQNNRNVEAEPSAARSRTCFSNLLCPATSQEGVREQGSEPLFYFGWVATTNPRGLAPRKHRGKITRTWETEDERDKEAVGRMTAENKTRGF